MGKKMNRIWCILSFLNIINPETQVLEPSKILLWGITSTIMIIMYNVVMNTAMTIADVGAFAGALTTLVGAFAAVIKLVETDNDKSDKTESTNRRSDQRHNSTFPRHGYGNSNENG